jgi:hypothetical protein
MNGRYEQVKTILLDMSASLEFFRDTKESFNGMETLTLY